MNPEERLAQIHQTLEAIQHGWPFLLAHLQEEIATHTAALIHQDNEQTRGAIKALARLIALPETLNHERESIQSALAQQAAE